MRLFIAAAARVMIAMIILIISAKFKFSNGQRGVRGAGRAVVHIPPTPAELPVLCFFKKNRQHARFGKLLIYEIQGSSYQDFNAVTFLLRAYDEVGKKMGKTLLL